MPSNWLYHWISDLQREWELGYPGKLDKNPRFHKVFIQLGNDGIVKPEVKTVMIMTKIPTVMCNCYNYADDEHESDILIISSSSPSCYFHNC